MNSSALARLNRGSLALATDLYQLTMAYGYWKTGLNRKEAVFHLVFREAPYQGGFAIAAGLGSALDFINQFHFDDSDVSYLASLTGQDGQRLFEPAFLDYLRGLRFEGELDAVPEGTMVFPQEPILRLQGSLLQCQLLETPLLNLINFQTLIATKAARLSLVTRGQPVLEFGLRRAQGLDGGLAASRAAFIGGCAATSNALAGKIYGIPVRGTHAHSWVMSFDSETEAFDAYARTAPNNCVFLVDTYNSLQGVRAAMEAGRRLRRRGHELGGIRLDSGDLAALSLEARRLLDRGGFPNAKIVASNDLDETVIQSLQDQGAAIDLWGVGTRLVTGHPQSALGGVFKLSALRNPRGAWKHTLKLSEQAAKVSTPGVLQVRRYYSDEGVLGDMIYDQSRKRRPGRVVVDFHDPLRTRTFPAGARHEDLLVPVFRRGRQTYREPGLPEMQGRTQAQLARFPAGVKRLMNPQEYPVGLEKALHKLKAELIRQARQRAAS